MSNQAQGVAAGVRATICAALAATLLLSCTGGGGEKNGGSTASGNGGSTASDAEVTAARAAIGATDLTKPETVGALESIRFTDAGVQAARDALGAGVEGDALWAATWVYATSGTDPAPLLPLLRNDDPSIRVLASAALASLGERSAIEVLVDAVPISDILRGSTPPISVGGFAAYTLARYTDGDLGGPGSASPSDRGAMAEAWRAWFDQHGPSLTFDESTGTWSG